jgi:hypothetical protein
MIREAELFVLADVAMVDVFRQIRAEQWDAELPPVFDMPGADAPVPLWQAVNHLAYDDAWVPDLAAGRTMDEVGRDRFDGDLLGTDPHGNVARIAAAAREAAGRVTDPDAPATAPMRTLRWPTTSGSSTSPVRCPPTTWPP